MFIPIQVDPAKLAQEIAKQINQPQSQEETIVWGLFALSGWIVAVALVWWWWRKDKERLTLELKRSETASKERESDKALLERSIVSMVDAATAMKTQADAIRELTGKIDGVAKDVLEIKLKKKE